MTSQLYVPPKRNCMHFTTLVFSHILVQNNHDKSWHRAIQIDEQDSTSASISINVEQRTCETDGDGLCLHLGHVLVSKNIGNCSLRTRVHLHVTKQACGYLTFQAMTAEQMIGEARRVALTTWNSPVVVHYCARGRNNKYWSIERSLFQGQWPWP